MTCIVGIAKDGIVYLAGDSALTAEEGHIYVGKRAKVFRNGEIVIGNSGSIRIPQLLEYADLPTVTEPIERYMVTEFIPALKKLLKDDEQKADNPMDDSAFLVGMRGHLFIVYSDFQASESALNYHAIGSASDIALGSLHTTRDSDIAPEQRLWCALNAAHAHNYTVREPFTILNTNILSTH